MKRGKDWPKPIIVSHKGRKLGAAERAGKYTVGLVHMALNALILFFLVVLLVYAVFALWDSKQLYNAGSSAQYESYKPSDDLTFPGFDGLCQLNEDVFGWLTVYGTEIDYPVVQGEDNNEYLSKSAEGHFSLAGAVFLDSRSEKDFSDFMSIIMGHHMEQSAMFGDLDKFDDKSFFDSHQYGNLYYEGTDHGIEFFAYKLVDAYDSDNFMTSLTPGTDAAQQYLDSLLADAKYTRDIGVTKNDHIVMLYTCSEALTNGRYLLIGRITPESFADPFQEEQIVNTGGGITGLGLKDRIEQLPLWMQIELPLIGVLIACLILLIIFWIFRKEKVTIYFDERYDMRPGGLGTKIAAAKAAEAAEAAAAEDKNPEDAAIGESLAEEPGEKAAGDSAEQPEEAKAETEQGPASE